MSDYLLLAKRLNVFAALLDPQKIAGHYNQAAIMREAAKAIRELVAARENDARRIETSNREAV
jgi:hypothetical protein